MVMLRKDFHYILFYLLELQIYKKAFSHDNVYYSKDQLLSQIEVFQQDLKKKNGRNCFKLCPTRM